ncbi:MAG: ParB/RepB/Spo0J family partition protein [Candidatus Doudnabacteria bacterium]|nr:ParB/RepB/Spo0J family partition protein [Candidatus Doudnabacteria bacterium]
MDNLTNSQPNITIQSLGGTALGSAPVFNVLSRADQIDKTDIADKTDIVPADRVSYADAQIQEIEVGKISPNPFQPRKVFESQALKELADSIKEYGVIQPLVVTRTPIGFELVVGERRFRAAQLAGLEKVPAIIKDSMVDQTKLEVALIENIQRKELNPIEEAQAYERLMKTFNMTQEQVAKKVGKSRPTIANTVRLLNLPAEIQRAVIEGKLSEGHARPLLGLTDPEKMLLMYKQVIEQGWNVRQVEAKVRELTIKRQMDAVALDPKLLAMESELRGKLGTQVKIQRQGKGGKIMIEFFSDEELNEIVHKMADQKAAEDGGYLTV